MKTITVYTPEELKEENPDGFEKALGWFRSTNTDIPWGNEIIDSLKAVFKASGIHLRDYSIDAYGYSHVRFEMDDEIANLQGQRAVAWLENNLLSDLRIPWQGKKRWELSQYGQYYRPGMVQPCPFTGVCFDEDMIEALKKSINSGDTLEEAYKNLADVASKLFEAEIEQANSEEEFLLQDHLQFTVDGDNV